MHQYSLRLKPVVAMGGVQTLDPTKRIIFDNLLKLIASIIQGAQEVDSVDVKDDHSLVINSSVDIMDMLQTKIGSNAIITKL